MEVFTDSLFFMLKTLIFVVGSLILFAGIVSILQKNKHAAKEKLHIKKLNTHFDEMSDTLGVEVLPKSDFKKRLKARQKSKKIESKQSIKRKRLYVLDFHGDIRATTLPAFREEVTALLMIATPEDEVLVRLESPGGLVSAYGLAASQLARFREKNISLTVCIDKVAASGGYMMACVANKIVAAPFAIIGSIGVVAQVPNIYRFLKKHNVDVEQFTAGEYKRTVSMLSPNTHKGKIKFKAQLEEIHAQFKAHIAQFRPELDLDKVATGEHWLATLAKELKLIDSLQTSDDYLLSRHNTHDLFTIKYETKQPLSQKFSSAVHTFAERYFPLSRKRKLLLEQDV